jgi:hypothetical protein
MDAGPRAIVLCISPEPFRQLEDPGHQEISHYDWTLVHDSGARYENLVAVHLHKWTTFLRETEGRDLDLRYARTIRGEEIDFVITARRNPILAIECKLSRQAPTPFLRLFASRFPQCRVLQVVAEPVPETVTPEGVHTIAAHEFLKELI